MRKLRVRRRGRIADVLGAALAAVLAFTVVPAVLVIVVGYPLAGGLGHAWAPASKDALCVLVVAAWIAWAACCAQLLRAVTAHVRLGTIAPLSTGSPLDRLAARIALGVLALSSLGASLALPTSAGAASAVRGHVGAPAAHGGTRLDPSVSERVTTSLHVVRPGETLWQIAEERMDDGADWTAIAALNLGADMAAGTRFVDPDQVRAGWRLRLPDSVGGAGPVRQAPNQGENPLGGHLPELVVLGLGSLTCALLARRARRHRECDRFTGDLDLPGPRSDDAIDTATLVNRFADVPSLASFEAANLLLARVLVDRAAPEVRAICVGPAGVTFWLQEPDPDAPEGFVPDGNGATWRVGQSHLDAAEPGYPVAPCVLPVGDDDDGTWLVVLHTGSVLPVLGESANDLVRAARAAQGSWAWADSVHVTDDPVDAALAVSARGGNAAEVPPHVLYVGDPGRLAPGLARRLAVVTTAMVPGTDLTVWVDRHGASIHPLGRVVRPHVLDEARSRAIEELTASPPVERRVGAEEPHQPPARAARSTDGPRDDAIAPGSVDVRLLTPTPRLDGLHEPLPPNRSRRAVELVAYLALHHPDVITSDRLRTRVLGSSDADAASKTLFNTAHAARKAMGVDEHGRSLFPTGTRNGLYQVSPRVTVDLHRAAALVTAGKACTDPPLAMAHFRAALELVEGEPLANALSGFSWWESEGHGGRAASVLVDGACALASLASGAGLYPLAWLGLERARMVAPYSEALSRAAMEVAAAEGDADRLRQEWRECQRLVDVLDPGSSPSTRTESLYGELARRVLVGTTGDVASAR